MTYNVFGGTLNLAQLSYAQHNMRPVATYTVSEPCKNDWTYLFEMPFGVWIHAIGAMIPLRGRGSFLGGNNTTWYYCYCSHLLYSLCLKTFMEISHYFLGNIAYERRELMLQTDTRYTFAELTTLLTRTWTVNVWNALSWFCYVPLKITSMLLSLLI